MRLAERQYGLVTLDQARALGLTDRQVRRKLATGRLRPMDRVVYCLPGLPASWEQSVIAAVLTAGEAALASHATAAYLWGLVGLRPERIEIVMPRWDRAARSFVVHESTDLAPEDRAELRNIPLSGPARTVVDLGASAPWLVEQALDAGVRKRLLTLEGVARVIGRVGRRGRRGVGVIRPLVEARAHWDGTTESELDDLFRRVLDQGGIPQPTPQWQVHDAEGSFVCRRDFAYADRRVLVELDSEAHHMDRYSFRRDRATQNRTTLLGWRTLRYTWWDLVTRPQEVRAEIRAALSVPA
ncbi:MAG: type IV toxin-antitoxin system AbiEi family antitoxin domain-containing protein [Acidimicrobiia bacterium]